MKHLLTIKIFDFKFYIYRKGDQILLYQAYLVPTLQPPGENGARPKNPLIMIKKIGRSLFFAFNPSYRLRNIVNNSGTQRE